MRYADVVQVPVTGPLPPELPAELEALKTRLAVMAPEDLPEHEAARIGVEISAIRLQLKRLALEREDMAEMIDEVLRLDPPPAA
jgi:hypothetical protein